MWQHLLLSHATVLPTLCPNLLLICSCPHCQCPYQRSLHDVSAVAAMLHQYPQLCQCIVSPLLAHRCLSVYFKINLKIRFCFRHIQCHTWYIWYRYLPLYIKDIQWYIWYRNQNRGGGMFMLKFKILSVLLTAQDPRLHKQVLRCSRTEGVGCSYQNSKFCQCCWQREISTNTCRFPDRKVYRAQQCKRACVSPPTGSLKHCMK